MLFSLVVKHFLAFVLLRILARSDVFLVPESGPGLATILNNDARLVGVHVVFETAS